MLKCRSKDYNISFWKVFPEEKYFCYSTDACLIQPFGILLIIFSLLYSSSDFLFFILSKAISVKI